MPRIQVDSFDQDDHVIRIKMPKQRNLVAEAVAEGRINIGKVGRQSEKESMRRAKERDRRREERWEQD